MKFMAINGVIDLEDPLFLKKNKGNTRKQFNLPLIFHPWQKKPLAE